jgi:hypothetical protein
MNLKTFSDFLKESLKKSSPKIVKEGMSDFTKDFSIDGPFSTNGRFTNQSTVLAAAKMLRAKKRKTKHYEVTFFDDEGFASNTIDLLQVDDYGMYVFFRSGSAGGWGEEIGNSADSWVDSTNPDFVVKAIIGENGYFR